MSAFNETDRWLNELKQWEEAEKNVLRITKEILEEFRQAKETDKKPSKETQEKARKLGRELSEWLQNTKRNRITRVRNDNLVAKYNAALDNWAKIGGRAVEDPYIVLSNIVNAQECICSAMSSGIQQFEQALENVGDYRRLLRLRDDINKQKENMFFQRGRQYDVESSFRDLRPTEKLPRDNHGQPKR